MRGAAHFPNVISHGMFDADGIELNEQANSCRLFHSLKDEPKLGSGLPHELGDQTIELYVEKRQHELARQGGGGCCLTGSGRTPVRGSLRCGSKPWLCSLCCGQYSGFS